MKYLVNKKVVLHIGLPKTGTTWLQNYFFPKQKGIHYIDVSPQNYPTKQHPVVKELVRVANISVENFDKKSLHTTVNKIHGYFVDGVNLLSNENYFTGMPETVSKESLLNITRNLHTLFPELKIIIIIRNQIELLSSFYLQKLFNSYENRTFGQFLIDIKNSLIPYLTYLELVENWLIELGKDNVYVSTYEDFKANKFQFLSDMSSFIGIKNPVICLNKNKLYINQSLSPYSSVIALLANKLYWTLNKTRILPIIKIGKSLNRAVIHFNKQWVDSILHKKINLGSQLNYPSKGHLKNYYKETNKKLSKLIKIDLKKYGYPCD
jgi:hypothetical protein